MSGVQTDDHAWRALEDQARGGVAGQGPQAAPIDPLEPEGQGDLPAWAGPYRWRHRPCRERYGRLLPQVDQLRMADGDVPEQGVDPREAPRGGQCLVRRVHGQG
eukprot:6591123-Pyramimonas_sp.AAC.1